MSTHTDAPTSSIETAPAGRAGDGDGASIVPDDPVPSTGRHGLGAFRGRVSAKLRPVWSDWRIGLAAAVAAAAGWGVIAGVWTPRGPLTTSEAIWSIVVSLAVGGFSGFVLRSRWAIVAAPVAFVAVFELVRIDTDGPTVDGIDTSVLGLGMFALGRGVHALLSLGPMAFGAVLGAGTARSIAGSRDVVAQPGRSWWRYTRRVVTAVAGLGLIVFVALLARPTSTDPIVDADGNEIPDSIAELTSVEVNGHDLHLMIRGHSIDNPVLLFLAGGPGGTELGAMRRHLPELEEHFTVATWDQRGSGKSYPELDPTSTLTLQGTIDDTIVVTNYLRDRFGQEQIYLVGQSWGTTLGVLAVQEEPELYAAYIGTGQMVSQLATDTIYYNDTIAWARANGDDGLVDELEALGPPPYGRILDTVALLNRETDLYPYDHSPNSEGSGQMGENLFVEEYTLMDQINALAAAADTFAVLYPQLQQIDFRETATDFDIPMFFVQGAHEADGRAELFDEWYPMIDAPVKDLAVFETSGHRPLWEQPDEFVDYMTDTVLARTDDR